METTVTIPLHEYNRLRDASIECKALKEKAEKIKAPDSKVSYTSTDFFDSTIFGLFMSPIIKQSEERERFIAHAISIICNKDSEKIGGLLISTKDKEKHFPDPTSTTKQQLYIMGFPVYACEAVKEGIILVVSEY